MRIRYKLSLPVSALDAFHLLHGEACSRTLGPALPSGRNRTLPAPPAAPLAARTVDRLGFAAGAVYYSFRHQPHAALVRTARGPWAFSRLGGSWRLVPDGPRHCHLLLTYRLHTAPHLGRLLMEPVAGAVFYLQTIWRMRALRRHCARLARRL